MKKHLKCLTGRVCTHTTTWIVLRNLNPQNYLHSKKWFFKLFEQERVCLCARLMDSSSTHLGSSMIYMATDTLLLADVFQSCRQGIQKNYGFDPAYYLTAPSLSWAAGLKYTGVKLEIPTDINTHIFFDWGLQGGVSMVANHFARANNKLMPEFFDPDKQQSFIKFVDANNVYG